ncbi:MAG TPA: amidohydrolase family protein [Acidimicrobiia bacterium]|nr:amidohydrolase family protein [Acidimicrobiia bacterium]
MERVGRGALIVPSLLRPRSSDEYAPVPWDDRLHRAAALTDERREAHALSGDDRRTTATVLRALDDVAGGGFYPLPVESEADLAVADEVFASTGPVIDVQTHLIDPARWHGDGADALAGYLRMVDADRWGDAVDPHLLDAAMWAGHVFASSETAIALLTSTPGDADHNVLLNPQIAAARELVDRYAGAGRVKTHTIVHPNVGSAELDRMGDLDDALRPSGWKCYPLYGPPTAASPTGGWFLDDDEIGFPFLERVRASRAPVVAVHKGIGGPIPSASVAAASPRDVGPAAAAFPDVTFLVYHSGYERDPDGEEGAFDPLAPSGVGRLVASLAGAGVGPGANVYAELGSTWYLMLRRPVEAAHVLGKLLLAVGPDRVVWGTDSIWYGSPQSLIDAFRTFEIPERMQAEFGYPALTPEIKAKILGVNARAVYGITDDDVARATADRARDWVAELQPSIATAITRAGRP